MSNEIAIIQQARNLPRVRDLETGAILKAITATIGKVYLIAGQVPKNEEGKKALKEDILFMASVLAKDIEIRFPGLTLEEIAIALEKGVRKDFGKYYGLNVVTFNDWIYAYANSPERLRAIDEQLKKKEIAAPIKLTPEQIEKEKKKMILVGFKLYKKMGSYPGRPDTLYRALEERGLINLSRNEKWELYAQAQKKRIKELETQKKEPKNHIHAKSIGDEIQSFLTPNIQTQGRIIFESKKIAIDNFYKNIVEKDLDITELVK